MKHVFLLAGARPNFMKIAPLHRALHAKGVATTLVHTGQHYDPMMSDVFFTELGIPAPDIHLGIGSGERITQTRKIIEVLHPILLERKPDGLIVVGDVLSTAAGTMAGVKANIPVIHVEAGLRSFNWKMPEELNRMIADHHADLLFASEPIALENLRAESIPDERVHLVGNIMIDSLRKAEPLADASSVLQDLNLSPGGYGLLTLHRPENVDKEETFRPLWNTLTQVAARLPLVFPVHPRTKKMLDALQIPPDPNIRMLEPIGYFDMMALTKSARAVFTDSGGLQEETTVFGVPCITMREQTERPITVLEGTSEVVGNDPEKILSGLEQILSGTWKKGRIPDKWDGHTAERIAEIIASYE